MKLKPLKHIACMTIFIFKKRINKQNEVHKEHEKHKKQRPSRENECAKMT